MNILTGRSLSALILCLCSLGMAAQEKRAMEVTDIMKFQQLKSPSISQDGRWVAHAAVPDRGDPRVLVYSTDGKIQYALAGANNPVISNDEELLKMMYREILTVPSDIENKHELPNPEPLIVSLSPAPFPSLNSPPTILSFP